MSVLIVIPARYPSARYPGKPLVTLRGASGRPVSLIQRSWNAGVAAAAPLGAQVVVATDDQRIIDHVEGFGGRALMTSDTCRNGTERCAEVLAALPGPAPEIVVNLQGDAPLTPAWFIGDLVAAMQAAPHMGAATPVLRMEGAALGSFLQDRREGRVGGTTAVFGQGGRALYFSKEVIPFVSRPYGATEVTPVFHHVGVYAYRPSALAAYAAAEPGPLELLEGLEQLRFLEGGQDMLCVQVEARGRQFWELNNPEDVPRIEAMLAAMGED